MEPLDRLDRVELLEQEDHQGQEELVVLQEHQEVVEQEELQVWMVVS